MLCYIVRFYLKTGRKERKRKDREGKEGRRQENYLLDNKNLEGVERYHGASFSVIQMQK